MFTNQVSGKRKGKSDAVLLLETPISSPPSPTKSHIYKLKAEAEMNTYIENEKGWKKIGRRRE